MQKQNFTPIDLTADKLFTLTDESKEQVKNIQDKVNIYFVGYKDDDTTLDLARQYTKANENITVEAVTSTDRPDLANKYGIESGSEGIIVENGEKYKVLSSSELYTYDSKTYESISIAEEKLTAAIKSVTTDSIPKVYFLSGYSSFTLTNGMQYLNMYLQNEVNEVESLDVLSTGKVPDDCNVLVITSLKEDFTEFEKDLILEYINNGGNLMILEDPNKDNKDLTNFQAILDVYGASISNGTMFEQNTSKIVGYTNIVLPNVSSASKITKDIASGGNVAILGGGIINFKDSEELENLGVTVENLVTASSTAFLRTDSSITSSSVTQNDKLLSGGEPIASAITKKINDEKTSKLILVANSMFASDWYVTLNSSSGNSSQVVAINFYNNRDLVINAVSYLTDREDNITIRKDTGVATYTATVQQDKIIRTIIIAVPVAIIILGIVVWQIRRRK